MDIALAGWSIHRRFRREQEPLKLLDYPRLAVEEFAINKIELNSPFFVYENPAQQATSPIAMAYLKQLKCAADDAGVKIVGIAVDGHGNLGSVDLAERKQAVENHRKWFDICHVLGCGAFRANSGGKGKDSTSEEVKASTESFAQLARWAEDAGINVLMENHWGISIDPDRMVQIITAVGSKNFGALADFGNFPDEYRLEGLRKISPLTKFVHAKFLEFDAAGEDPRINGKACIEIFKKANYRGLFGIEFEGKGDDHEGVVKSKALLQRYAYC
jgi:sugar phosphate isomerase/epimerase